MIKSEKKLKKSKRNEAKNKTRGDKKHGKKVGATQTTMQLIKKTMRLLTKERLAT